MYNGTESSHINGMEQARFYADQHALKSAMRAGETEVGTLKRAAEEFESLFINMLFKTMRQANEVFGKDNMFESQESTFFREMLDNQWSVEMARGGGIGLADMMMRQLAPTLKTDESDSADVPEGEADQLGALTSDVEALGSAQMQPRESHSVTAQAELLYGDDASAILIQDATRPVGGGLERLDGDQDERPQESLITQNTTLGNDAVTEETTVFKTPETFVATVWPHAKTAAKSLGVDPRILVAQAALETGWGKHIMGNGEGGSSKNLFGIKARADQPRAVLHETTEFVAGSPQKEQAHFRTYESFSQSFADYVGLLTGSTRYTDARAQAADPKAFVNALQSAGYATDPQYANKIYRIFQGIDQKLSAAGIPSEQWLAYASPTQLKPGLQALNGSHRQQGAQAALSAYDALRRR